MSAPMSRRNVRASAYVNANGTLDKARSRGFVSARKTGEGNYCLTLQRRVDPATTVWVASIVRGTVAEGELWVAYVSPETCGDWDIGIRTARSDNSLGVVGPSDSAFMVVVV